mmetsp:Transcript_10612/g.35110  ORF Transcript_10612/g.35110 Transcript_10612/m.35110 type:complete len:260 (+) Transcript_10612:542-1321(+)
MAADDATTAGAATTTLPGLPPGARLSRWCTCCFDDAANFFLPLPPRRRRQRRGRRRVEKEGLLLLLLLGEVASVVVPPSNVKVVNFGLGSGCSGDAGPGGGGELRGGLELFVDFGVVDRVRDRGDDLCRLPLDGGGVDELAGAFPRGDDDVAVARGELSQSFSGGALRLARQDPYAAARRARHGEDRRGADPGPGAEEARDGGPSSDLVGGQGEDGPDDGAGDEADGGQARQGEPGREAPAGPAAHDGRGADLELGDAL